MPFVRTTHVTRETVPVERVQRYLRGVQAVAIDVLGSRPEQVRAVFDEVHPDRALDGGRPEVES